jgi:hypothetical protein
LIIILFSNGVFTADAIECSMGYKGFGYLIVLSCQSLGESEEFHENSEPG